MSFQASEEVDVLVTTGGVSMGDLDLLKPILRDIGEIHFGRLNMVSRLIDFFVLLCDCL